MKRRIESMRDFGYQIGMAFQIVDDILDFNGEQVCCWQTARFRPVERPGDPASHLLR